MGFNVRLLSFIFLISTASCISTFPKLLLISFDGFRYDLLNKTMTPNIYEWTKEATWFVNGSQSQYITYTAPNHLSIVTGLYEESHGIVSNYFFDYATNEIFDYFNSTKKEGVVNASLDGKWYNGEPIWLTNERSDPGRRSSSFYWPNGEAPFPAAPHRPSSFRQWKTYGNLSRWQQDVDDIVTVFTSKENPVNFMAWYVAEPDHTLHTNGFFNGELVKKVKELDEVFGYLLKRFDSFGLREEVNIILTADHGHAEIIDEKHVMCIPDYVKDKSIRFADHMIYPRDDLHAKEIFTNLTEGIKKHGYKVAVHMKENFEEKYHYQHSSRIGRIIIEPEIGSAISFSCTKEKLAKDYSTVKFNSSTHGMDPNRPEMRAFLLMGGPAFIKNQTIYDIPMNIDLYPFMCRILGVVAAPNNGSTAILDRALRTRFVIPHINFNAVTDNMGFFIFMIPPVLVVLLYFALGCRHTILKQDPDWARTGTSKGYRPLQMDPIDIEAGGGESPRPLRADAPVKMSGLLQNDGWSDEDFEF